VAGGNKGNSLKTKKRKAQQRANEQTKRQAKAKGWASQRT
jgi:hypothetical protein